MTEEFGSSEAGRKGGEARAQSLSKDKRAEIAREAAAARWHANVPQARAEGVLTFGEVSIPCAVIDLPDEGPVRVLTQRGVFVALGRHKNPSTGQASIADKPAFLAAQNLTPYITKELERSWTPIRFKLKHSIGGYQGNIAFGYRATILPLVCRVFLDADAEGKLLPSQKHIALHARMLLTGLGTVGIIGLVDEATGFQDERARNALAEILEQFIAKELRRWVKTFPLDYFKELCRLRGVVFAANMQMPPYFGHLTNNLIYSRLAPGVLQELKRINPMTDNGRRKNKHHQHLSDHVGHPKLLQHLGSVVTIMKLSETWADCVKMIDKLHPPEREMPLFKGLQQD
jgi:hypothetical protein